MVTRTFKQFGQGYGDSAVTVRATIDGTVVYDGPIDTLDQPVPTEPIPPGGPIGNVIYTWTNDVTFEGTQTLELEVGGGGALLFTKSIANYANVANIGDPANTYIRYYSTEVNGVVYTDPLTDETIDGVLQDPTPYPPYTGAWFWTIHSGSVFTANINVQAGNASTI